MPRIVDLTLAIEDNMVSHKNLVKPVLIPHTTHESSKKYGQGTPEDPQTYSTTFMSMLDHTGTHVDAFLHVKPDGLPVDEMPIEMFMGKAVCFDLRHIPDLGTIDVAEMEAAEKKSGVKVDGHIVLLCTGLHKRHWPKESIAYSNPAITWEATKWLADRGSKLHGVEGPSTDRPTEKTFANHRACRDLGITHYEWLVNLEELIGVGEFHFEGVPLKLKGASGSPVRALAFLD
jgi:kynurenine formamidase